DVEFEDNISEDGLLIAPLVKGRLAWRTDKLYDVPVRVTNTSQAPQSLKGRYLNLPSVEVWAMTQLSETASLKPGESTQLPLVLLFGRAPSSTKLTLTLPTKKTP